MASRCLVPSVCRVNGIVCCLLVLVCLEGFWQFSLLPVQATQAAAVSWPSPELRAVWSSGMWPRGRRIAPIWRLTQKQEVSPPASCGGWAAQRQGGCLCLLCCAVPGPPPADPWDRGDVCSCRDVPRRAQSCPPWRKRWW